MWDFIYNLWFIYNECYMMGMGEKKREIQINEKLKPRKKFPVWLNFHPFLRLRNCGRCPKTPKTSRTYPECDRDPSLVGQEIQGWARYGQLKTGNMNYIHVNFQDFQQKRAGAGLLKRQPTCLRQRKYSQLVKDQGEDVHGARFCLAL